MLSKMILFFFMKDCHFDCTCPSPAFSINGFFNENESCKWRNIEKCCNAHYVKVIQTVPQGQNTQMELNKLF